MDLDRDSILRSDFGLSRRGYDPAAVDAHLLAIVAAFELAGPAPSAAATASAKVASIVAAAEAAAAEIEREAREKAARLSEDAIERARDDATRVVGAADSIAALMDAVDAELHELLASMRTRAEAIGAAMSEIEASVSSAFAVGTTPADASEPVAPARAKPAAAPEPASTPSAEPIAPGPADRDESTVVTPAAPEPALGNDATLENARLVALDMALSGSSRADIDGYLAANFDLDDRAALVDEVVAAAGA